MSALLLTTTVTVLRGVRVGSDRLNRPTFVWNTVPGGATVKARRELQAGRETVGGVGEEPVSEWLWWLEPVVAVTSRDRLQHSSGVYEVIAPPEDWSEDPAYGAFLHLEVMTRFLVNP